MIAKYYLLVTPHLHFSKQKNCYVNIFCYHVIDIFFALYNGIQASVNYNIA